MFAETFDYGLLSGQSGHWVSLMDSDWVRSVDAALELSAPLEGQIHNFQIQTGLPADELLGDFQFTGIVRSKYTLAFARVTP
jgi:hypothetical protein